MRRIILCAALCGLICQATGCISANKLDESSLQEQLSEQKSEDTQSEQAEQTTATSAEKTVQEVMPTEEATEQVGAVTAEASEEPQTIEEVGLPETAEVTDEEQAAREYEKSLVGKPAVDSWQELKEISPDNIFVDFSFISDCEGNTDPVACGDALGSIILAFKQTEEYQTVCKVLSSGKPLTGPHTERREEPIINDYVHDFYEIAEGGEYNPIFHTAFVDDFDSDGREEQFVLLKFPHYAGEFDKDAQKYELYSRYYLMFADADGNAEMVGDFWGIHDISMLDYGMDKQLIISSTGTCGADDHDPLYGVVDGKAVQLCVMRGSYAKWKCFLTSAGWQGSGAFMYYDTAAKEYRAVTGLILDKYEVDAMEGADELPYEPDEYYQVTLVGGKYYLFRFGAMDHGVPYVYEDGKFTPAEGCPVRSPNDCTGVVLIDDIDKAVEDMITPEEVSGDLIVIE